MSATCFNFITCRTFSILVIKARKVLSKKRIVIANMQKSLVTNLTTNLVIAKQYIQRVGFMLNYSIQWQNIMEIVP